MQDEETLTEFFGSPKEVKNGDVFSLTLKE